VVMAIEWREYGGGSMNDDLLNFDGVGERTIIGGGAGHDDGSQTS
jgi:hypothetical protein